MATQPKDFVPRNYHLPGGSYAVACTSTLMSDILSHLASNSLQTGGLEQTLYAGSAGHIVVLGRDGQRIGAVVSRDEKPVIYELYLPQ